jgi:hypothetical protein
MNNFGLWAFSGFSAVLGTATLLISDDSEPIAFHLFRCAVALLAVLTFAAFTTIDLWEALQ